MSVALHRVAGVPGQLVGGPPLILAAALGLAAHHLRTRKNVLR